MKYSIIRTAYHYLLLAMVAFLYAILIVYQL